MAELGLRIYTGILVISIAQYWLSLRFRNYMIPLGIGSGLVITGLLLGNWFPWFYFPYQYALYMFSSGHSEKFYPISLLFLLSVGSFMAVLYMAFRNLCAERVIPA